jgi:predicted Fe-Mo cluster-binding NifX family protein
MRVAVIKSGVVINVIEVADVLQIPDWFIVAVETQGNIQSEAPSNMSATVIRKSDCDFVVVTQVGSKNDLYEEGVGFYRQYNTNVQQL